MYHNPVLLHESVEGLNINPDGVYVDVTFGGGGHSREILSKLKSGHLFGFDQDQDAAANSFQDDRFTFISQNFRYLKNFLMLHGHVKVDGILADLGVSSHQFDVASKGFSTRFDGILDMRMSQLNPVSAAEVVNTWPLEQLTKILTDYGELPNAFKMAQSIVAYRTLEEIRTTTALRDAVKKNLPIGKENKFLAQLFQALRIEVNQEMQALEEFLNQTTAVLKPGGRLVVISYHSLEDRMVKNFMKAGKLNGEAEKDFFGNNLSPFKLVSRKAIMPSGEEIAGNNRARSARLRIAERK